MQLYKVTFELESEIYSEKKDIYVAALNLIACEQVAREYFAEIHSYKDWIPKQFIVIDEPLAVQEFALIEEKD